VIDVHTVNYNSSHAQFAVAFDPRENNTQDPDLELRWKPKQSSGLPKMVAGTPNPNKNQEQFTPNGKILIIQESAAGCDKVNCSNPGPDDELARPAGYHIFKFSYAVDVKSIDFVDIETEEGMPTSPDNEAFFWTDPVDVVGADQGAGADGSGVGASLAMNPDTNENHWHVPYTGNRRWTREEVNVKGVYQMRLEMGGSGAFTGLMLRASQIDEPAAAAAIVLSGLLSLMVLRRRPRPSQIRTQIAA